MVIAAFPIQLHRDNTSAITDQALPHMSSVLLPSQLFILSSQKTHHLRNEQWRSEVRIQRPYSERSKNRKFWRRTCTF